MPSVAKKLLLYTKNIHFQSLLGNGSVAVFGVLIMGILYHGLTRDNAGMYALFLTIFGFVDTFRTGFLTFPFVKFYTGTSPDREREITGSTWMLAIVITTGFVILNLILQYLWPVHDDDLLFFIKYFPWLFIAGLPYFMATIIVQGNKRFDRLLVLRLINQLLYIIFIIMLAFMKIMSIDKVLVFYIISNLVTSLFAMFAGWTSLDTIKNRSRTCMLEIYNFGKFSFGTNLSATMFKVTDVFFINFYLNKAALAIYTLGGRLLQIIEIPLGSLTASGMAALSDHFNKNEKKEMMHLMKKMTGMVSFGLMILAVLSIIFAYPIIYIIGGEQYIHTEAPNLFRLFMSIAILYPADRFFAVALDVIHKPQINFYKILIMLASNIAGDFIGLQIYRSIYSVVLVGLIPTIIAIVVAYIPLKKYSPFSLLGIYTSGYRSSVELLRDGWRSAAGRQEETKQH